MKVLKGTLCETRFSYPKSSPDSQLSSGLKVIKKTTYNENEVTYMSDELGLHKISNPDPQRLAVSLHRKCRSACSFTVVWPIPVIWIGTDMWLDTSLHTAECCTRGV
jgi:hypothetical protein